MVANTASYYVQHALDADAAADMPVLGENGATAPSEGMEARSGAQDEAAFVTTWQTARADEGITIPVGGATGTYTVDWGDGSTTTHTGDATHVYGVAGTYTVQISGDFTRIYLGGGEANAQKLQSIEQWGDVGWDSMMSAFYGATNMVYNATDAPDLSGVTSMADMFHNAALFDGDISGWDVSSATDMGSMFFNARSFNQPLNGWNVSSVEDMSFMFSGATYFDQPLNGWNVSSVEDMSFMFSGATYFDQPLNGWNVSSVEDMSFMFSSTSFFNQPLDSWDVSSVADMNRMFAGATAFNGDISNWNVSSVTDMSGMLSRAYAFDQNLGDWYIVLDDAAIDYGDAPGVVGSISAQNQALNYQSPAYRLGSGGDSDFFEMDGARLKMKGTPAKGSYFVTLTATGDFGRSNSKVVEVTVTGVPAGVDAVPIVVRSTTADYFVLYVRHALDPDTTVEMPVLAVLGENGTTALAESVEALSKERYRVEKYLVADPADVDGDGIDDVTELSDPVGMNPVNPVTALDPGDGAVSIPDWDTFKALSFDILGMNFTTVKFVILHADTALPHVYFMNGTKYPAHSIFLDVLGVTSYYDDYITGSITYDPEIVAPDGSLGVYHYELSWWTTDTPFNLVDRTYTLLAANMPLLEDNLALHVSNRELPLFQSDLPLYAASRVNLVFDDDILPETDFLALNPGEGYGMLQTMEPDERPNPRDVVIYEALPNELPRVAGIISTVPQTPLSHVNLRAVQDSVPNAFIRDVLEDAGIDDLIGSYVYYNVTEDGWDLRAATRAEVDAHYGHSRPTGEQVPQRDLSVTSITPLSDVGFEDWEAFGVKAANVAVLGKMGFPEGTVPDGFAVPFYFYDEFMKANGLYARIDAMLADPALQTDFDVQEDELKKLRKAIKKAETPAWIITELEEMHGEFSNGISLRYRSSTNNEDLPGFNGAGLYDSKTQDPEETEEDGIDKSLKSVYASLWNFRAFTERDFHRINHTEAAMGILVHPNYSDELANGVAVSFDPVRDSDGNYYVNTQIGEDLVTNPEVYSIPEEILLDRYADQYTVLATSNQVPPGQLLMSDDQLYQLRLHLATIHEEFADLYGVGPGERFAMEIEFKITSEDILAIKQARPWIFNSERSHVIDGTPPVFSSATYDKGTGVLAITLSEDISGTADLAKLHVRESGQPSSGTALTGATQSIVGYTIIITLTDSQRTAVNDMTAPTLDIDAGAVSDGIDHILVTRDRAITIVNSDPVVDAGPDQTVDEGYLVTLNATVTDADGDNMTYSWTHDSPLAIQLANPASPSTTFAAPAVDADTEITFTLTADDGTVTASDSLAVTVTDVPTVNSPPVADAGPDQTVDEGYLVTLNATVTDADGDNMTYSWTHDSPLAIQLANPASPSTTFAAPAVDADTEITFTLTADDGTVTASDSLAVTVTDVPTVNSPPVADAGPDKTVQEGQAVTLNGTATDTDGDGLTYAWSHDSSTEITFNASSPVATFAAPPVDADTTVTFTLAVSDGSANSTDAVLVTVIDVPDDSDFVTTWETAAPGESITIPARGTYTISWGDGTVDAGVTGDQTHAYDVPGNHTIRISKGITGINLGNHADAPKLRSIDQWGDAKWSTMYSAFRDASSMTLRAADAPDLSRVKYTQYMFLNASSFDGDLSAWDVSHVTNMVGMFWEASSFDGDLSAWDVSSVTDMFTMFYNARSFDGNISAWDVSSVRNMANMFHGASSFDGDLSAWDVSSVTDTYAMFLAASSFDGDLSGWDVSRVTDMADMFRSASSFDGDVSGWDVSRATRMSTMFYLADSFDQNLGEWYIVLDDAAIDHSSVPREVGRIAAQNRFLDGHNPAYGIGSGGDSAHFEIDGSILKMKSVPDGHAGPYSVTVTSTGAYGSENSRTFDISVTEGDANTPPVASSGPRGVDGFTLTSTQPGTIEVTWDAPGEAPRDYRVAWAKVGENFLSRSDLTGNAFPTSPNHTITGLEGGEYQAKVRARYNSGGAGNWSEVATVTVLAPPDPRGIGEINLTSAQPGTIQVSWEAPGEAPRDYRVAWAEVGESFLGRSNLDGNAFPTSPNHTITGLEEGEEYKVKVRARYSDNGPGDWSDEVTITVARS